MGIDLSLSSTELEVEPGREAGLDLQLRNTGATVDQFTLSVVGDLGDWATVEPKIINLYPGDEGEARLVLKPPKSSDVLAGEIPFAVRAVSREDPEGSVVEEGTVTVAAFTEVAAEFIPHGSRGSFRARHRLAVDNHGNTPMPVTISMVNPNNELLFKVRRTSLTIPPGAAVLVPVRVIPKKRFLKGTKKTHPFQAVVTGDGFPPVTADAAMVQEQILPAWLPRALAALIALSIAFAILWFTVLKPTLKTQVQNGAPISPGTGVSPSAGASPSAQPSPGASPSGQPSPGASPSGQPSAGASQGTQPSAGAGQGAKASGGASQGAGGTNQSSGATGKSTQPAASAGAQATQGGGTVAGGGTTGGGSTQAPSNTSTSPPSSPADVSISTDTPAGDPGTFKTFNSQAVPSGKSLLITDILVSNPNGDSGYLQIRRGDSTLFPLGLDNFRSYDLHFVEPIRFGPGDQVVIAVDCRNSNAACTPSVFLSGKIQ
ncbi:hypothetical protein AB0D08_11520 [Kitasatospora sp. NPDC048540]|uniref:COG1470 family protein n=1 Tax=Kitasatospora sp. NPDC048540 TaxID=3155634 RepID=UPI0033E8CA18